MLFAPNWKKTTSGAGSPLAMCRRALTSLKLSWIITGDGKVLAVPNAEIINKSVTSQTNFLNIRPDIEVTIGVSEDMSKVRQVLLEIVNGDPDYLEDPPARVIVTQLNDYNIALELQTWIRIRENIWKKGLN